MLLQPIFVQCAVFISSRSLDGGPRPSHLRRAQHQIYGIWRPWKQWLSERIFNSQFALQLLKKARLFLPFKTGWSLKTGWFHRNTLLHPTCLFFAQTQRETLSSVPVGRVWSKKILPSFDRLTANELFCCKYMILLITHWGCLSTLTLSILTLSRMTLSKVSVSDILRNDYLNHFDTFGEFWFWHFQEWHFRKWHFWKCISR